MKYHLLLQGEIRIGKSTLIRNALLPHIDQVGGYFVQRIFLRENPKIYVGFAVKPLDANIEYLLNNYVDNLENVKGLFLFCTPQGNWEQIPGAFAKYAADSLNNALLQKKKLILMDEIGGMELQDNSLSDMVFHIFDGNIPVLGVLKSPVNIEKLGRAAGGGLDIVVEGMLYTYDKIKNHSKVDVITILRSNQPIVETKVREFAKGVLK